MAKQGALTLFPELEQATKKLSNEQFGILMRALWAYRYRGESYAGEDVAVDIAFQFAASQIDRSEDLKSSRSKAANARWNAESNANECKDMQTVWRAQAY